MIVTFVTTHMNKSSGVAVVIKNYAESLTELGYEVKIVAQRINQKIWYLNPKIKLIEIGGPLPTSPLYWIFLNTIIKRRYLNALSKFYSDIIIPQLFPVHYFCTKLDKKKYRKIIYFCYEPYRFFHDSKYYKLASPLEKLVMKFLKIRYKKFDIEGARESDIIIAISKFIQKKILTHYDRNSDIIYPFPKKSISFNEEIRKNKQSSDKKVIFALGLSSHSKGVAEMMEIYNKVQNKAPDIKLVIGGTILKRNLKIIMSKIKEHKIPIDSIVFYGYIKEIDLPKLYRKATLTIYTAIDESFGLIPVESMNYGTPVIAFEGGPSETIIDGETGFIIKNYDIDGFVEKALILLQDSDLRLKFSLNCLKHSNKNFNFNQSLKILINKFSSNS